MPGRPQKNRIKALGETSGSQRLSTENVQDIYMQRIVAMNKLDFSLEDTITPSIRKRLKILKEKQREWFVYPSGFQELEVRKGDQSYGVSLQHKFSIKPAFRTNMWKMTNDVPPLPPIIRKMPGRPQKKRIQAPGETNGSHCASRGGGRSGRGDGNDGNGSGSSVTDGSGRGGGRASGSGRRGGGRAGGSGKRGGGRAAEYYKVFIPNIHSQPTQQSGVWVVDTTASVADVDEAPEQETSDDGPAPEQGKSPAVDKGKAKASVEDGPAPKKKRRMPPSGVDGIRIYHKNRGRSERIANMKLNKPFQFDKFGTGSTPDKAFDVKESSCKASKMILRISVVLGFLSQYQCLAFDEDEVVHTFDTNDFYTMNYPTQDHTRQICYTFSAI
ncbi:hypothetical protein Tco_0874687 [Tanacetum coccineum]|uniref:Uncharacterized protein n=1 Tax=Tanacetum coccineum TaxID=301880 RepID=A0ABQ5BMB4_9ASTR